MDLIKLVDAEIFETQQKLVTLRAQLQRSMRPEPKMTVLRDQAGTSREQTNTVKPVLVKKNVTTERPLNHCTKRYQKTVSDNSIDSAFSSAASTEAKSCSPITSPQTIPKTVWISSPDDTLSMSSQASSNAEERYLSKLKKMYQNRENGKQVESQHLKDHQSDLESCDTNNRFPDHFVEDIVEKICDKLQNIRPLQEKEEKELRSVAVETTFANQIVISSSDDNSSGDEESLTWDDEQSVQFLHDQALPSDDNTVYMHLPAKGQSRKVINHQQHKEQEISLFSLNELTQYRELEKERNREKPPALLIDFVEDSSENDHHQNEELNFNFDNTCHTSLFKTLSEIQSTMSASSTPKRRSSRGSSSQSSASTIEQIRNSTAAATASNSTISFSTAYDSSSYHQQQKQSFSAISFSVDTMSREHIMNVLSTSDVFDNDQLWEDVLDRQ